MTTRTPRQHADAILATLRTAPLAGLYWWRCVPLEEHNEVCRHLGDLALRQIAELDNEHSDRSTAELEASLQTIWPSSMPVELEEFLWHELAAIERLATFRVIEGDGG